VRRPPRPAAAPALAATLAALAALAGAGCGATAHHRPAAPAPAAAAEPLAPAARPAAAPAPTATPAGRVLRVGPLADAVTADPQAHEFAVAVHDPSRLILVDSRSGRVRQRVAIPTGQPHDGLPPAPAVFLVPAEFGRRALAIQPALRTAPATLPGAAALVLGRTFVADDRGIAVLDRGRPTRHLPDTDTGAGAIAGMAPADLARRLAVVASRERTLSLYDPRSLRRLATTPAGRGPTTVVADGDLIYVADTRGDAVLIFSTRPRLAPSGRIALPAGSAPYGLALDPVRRRLWVTLTARNEVVALPVDGTKTPARRLPTVRQPDAVAVDSARGTVAVTGRAAGVLQLIPRRRAYPPT
jgi:hypothetical protein